MNRKKRATRIVVLLLSFCVCSIACFCVGLKIGRLYERNWQFHRSSKSENLKVSMGELVGLTRFYSQSGQDRWVTEVAFPGVRDGYFVEVGSGDGIVGSNSKRLEELGWSGICIDPFPTNMEGRTCQMFREVVDSEAGRKVSFRKAHGLGGIEEHMGKWSKSEQVRRAKLVELTTTTLGDILERAGAPRYIQYVSLDIEGAELEALKGFPFDKHTVGAWTIEHNFEEPKRSQIRELLESHGYHLDRSLEQDDCYLMDKS